jgi:hypothetical protein
MIILRHFWVKMCKIKPTPHDFDIKIHSLPLTRYVGGVRERPEFTGSTRALLFFLMCPNLEI